METDAARARSLQNLGVEAFITRQNADLAGEGICLYFGSIWYGRVCCVQDQIRGKNKCECILLPFMVTAYFSQQNARPARLFVQVRTACIQAIRWECINAVHYAWNKLFCRKLIVYTIYLLNPVIQYVPSHLQTYIENNGCFWAKQMPWYLHVVRTYIPHQ